MLKRVRIVGGFALAIALLSSIWLASKVGGSPPFRVAVFLFGCSVWIGVLTWIRDVAAGREAHR